eukprot:4476311-Prymnesium_polylepis.2
MARDLRAPARTDWLAGPRAMGPTVLSTVPRRWATARSNATEWRARRGLARPRGRACASSCALRA